MKSGYVILVLFSVLFIALGQAAPLHQQTEVIDVAHARTVVTQSSDEDERSMDSSILWHDQLQDTYFIWIMRNADPILDSQGTPVALPVLVHDRPKASWKLVGQFNSRDDLESPWLIWQEIKSGRIVADLMDFDLSLGQNNFKVLARAQIGLTPVLSPWAVMATGDMNNDGRTDIILQNLSTGQVKVWLLHWTRFIGERIIQMQNSSGWRIKGVGDFNQDGCNDILWRNDVSGGNKVSMIVNFSVTSEAPVISVGIGWPEWEIVSVSDLTHYDDGSGSRIKDGMPDIVWRNQSNNEIHIWKMKGTENNGWTQTDVVNYLMDRHRYRIVGPK